MDDGVQLRRTLPGDARLFDWRAPDGWVLRRMEWTQSARHSARGNLLFVNGRGDFIEKYLEAYRWWHARGWNVDAFDWRGQGRSHGDIAGGNVLSFDPLVEDLAALIADWREGSPGPHAAVAHSMGGHLLLRALAEREVSLDAAVLVAPMIGVNSAPLSPSLAPLITDFMCLFGWRDMPLAKASEPGPGARRQRVLTGSPERYADEAWWWEQEPGLNLGVPSWGWMRAAYRSSAAFTSAKLARVKLPLLLIGTERDRLVTASAIRRAAALIPGARLHMYADARHEILRDVDSVRLDALARIDAFLDEHAR